MNDLESRNLHKETVSGFGDEWSRFTQSELDPAEHDELFQTYFSIFPWHKLDDNPVGMDVGCGSGRWAMLVAPRVEKLHCLDASKEALAVAKVNLTDHENIEFHNKSVDEIPVSDASLDFAYSLGVLHHIPDTQKAIESVVRKMKPGAPLLLYLYYSFDNRPKWFRLIWLLSELPRRVISRLPHSLRYAASQLIAFTIYWPLARSLKLLTALGVNCENLPLYAYKDLSVYVMRTDALDRFGTQLEQRFSRAEITAMMEEAGLTDIQFSDSVPFWCSVGVKKG